MYICIIILVQTFKAKFIIVIIIRVAIVLYTPWASSYLSEMVL